MPRLARSSVPLYITRGRPFSFPMRLTAPGGTAIDLTGASVVAQFASGDVETQIPAVVTNAADGRFTVSVGPVELVNLRTESPAKLVVSVLDTLGTAFDFVYPIVVEAP